MGFVSNFLIFVEVSVWLLWNLVQEIACWASIVYFKDTVIGASAKTLAKNSSLGVSRKTWGEVCAFVFGVALAPLAIRWLAGHSLRDDVWRILALPFTRPLRVAVGPAAPAWSAGRPLPGGSSPRAASDAAARAVSPSSKPQSSTGLRSRK